jgi:nucleoside-diphosphate-sugar epimerase
LPVEAHSHCLRSGAPDDVKHSLADISLAKSLLGYKPRYNPETGLARTVEWFKSHVPSQGRSNGS